MSKRNIISILLGILFIILTVLVMQDKLVDFDNYVYNVVTSNMNDKLTIFYKIFTFLGSTVFMVSLCVVVFIFFLIIKRKDFAFISASILIISTIINNVIKLIIKRGRPVLENPLVYEKSYSFPSGHTMAAVSMYGILIYIINKSNLNKKLKITLSIILGIIPILVMLSRIYLGAHFASDVIGALLVSSILLLVGTSIIDKKGWIKHHE